MKKLITAAALLGLSAGVYAQDLNWNYVELGYAQSTRTSNIYQVGAGLSFSPINLLAVRAAASTGELGSGSLKTNSASVGLLGYIPVGPGANLFGSVDRSRNRLRGFGRSNAWDYEVGIRNAWGGPIETDLAVNYTDISGGSGEFGARTDLRYAINPTLSLGVGYQYNRRSDNAIGLSARVNF